MGWISNRCKTYSVLPGLGKSFLWTRMCLLITCSRVYSTVMNLLGRITVEPGKCGGRPCVRGMRIRVKDVLDMLAEGAKQEEILADFPDLQPEDIQACIAYAARYVDHSVLVSA
jgi:uncharacterized protein (DUF433 family)